MNKPIQTSDRALSARVLPALRMMVRFPTRPIKNVSFETGIELSDIETWVALHGRPTRDNLLDVARWYAGGDAPEAAWSAEAAEAADGDREDGREMPRTEDRPEPARAHVTRSARAIDWTPVLRILWDEPDAKEYLAAERCGLSADSFAGFKIRTFGKGPLDRTKLREWLQMRNALPEPAGGLVESPAPPAPPPAPAPAPVAPVAAVVPLVAPPPPPEPVEPASHGAVAPRLWARDQAILDALGRASSALEEAATLLARRAGS